MAKQIEETKRKNRKLSVRPIVIIVCDGEKTEPNYFNNFKQQRHTALQIEIVSGCKNYRDIIKSAGIAETKYVTNTNTKYDVWCVSDVDTDIKTSSNQEARNAQLKEYFEQAEAKGFHIALSNPCFELWYLLHFVYTTSEMLSYKEVEQKLSTPAHIPNYDKRKDYFNILAEKMELAIKNAKKLKKFHVEQGKTSLFDVTVNPYTNVWELVEFINTRKT